MKIIAALSVLLGLSRAHYAIKSLTIDGTDWLARDARLDDWVGAKRIEWSYTDQQNFTWMAITDHTSQDIACGANPKAPPRKAVARAGSDITIQWTNIPRHHLGPSMSYLGLWTGQKPTQVSFFKVNGMGYDASKRLWANEIIIKQGQKDHFKIPSDIKPGTYILRSELLSLHGNGQYMNPGLKGLPQFYTHCFNIEITGSGTSTPPGVRFPGAYAKKDPGVTFILGQTARYPSYPTPGPPTYKGQFSAPIGARSTPTAEQLGRFPAAFETKYRAALAKWNVWSDKAVEFFDSGKGGFQFFTEHQREATALMNQRDSLRKEAIALKLADSNIRMVRAKVF